MMRWEGAVSLSDCLQAVGVEGWDEMERGDCGGGSLRDVGFVMGMG